MAPFTCTCVCLLRTSPAECVQCAQCARCPPRAPRVALCMRRHIGAHANGPHGRRMGGAWEAHGSAVVSLPHASRTPRATRAAPPRLPCGPRVAVGHGGDKGATREAHGRPLWVPASEVPESPTTPWESGRHEKMGEDGG